MNVESCQWMVNGGCFCVDCRFKNHILPIYVGRKRMEDGNGYFVSLEDQEQLSNINASVIINIIMEISLIFCEN